MTAIQEFEAKDFRDIFNKLIFKPYPLPRINKKDFIALFKLDQPSPIKKNISL